MHIPDGYLSPATAAVAFGAAAPFWYHASKKVERVLKGESAPLVALFAAFSFTVQMFNFPLPGGTTAHAVGGTLVAVVLGPWSAVVSVSTALLIQALFFGDGGITAIGANCFNMGIALPLVGYGVYRVLAGRTPSHRRRVLAGALGAYAGINVAGLLTSLELGVQPLLWSDGGRALYSPYGLEVTVPAMMITHLTLAGWAEAALTGLTLSYLLRTHPALFGAGGSDIGLGRLGSALIAILAALVVFTPIGLLAQGTAEFEWSSKEVEATLGYAPSGLASLEGLWRAPIPGYQLPGETGNFLAQAGTYLLSGLFGTGLIVAAIFATRIILTRRTSTVDQ